MRSVDLDVADGEVHALLGANGAGKSTLIKCVSGAVRPDSGEIRIGEQVFSALTPRGAKQAGVAVIYQDFSLAQSLNVTENIFLGQELRRGPIVRAAAQRKRAGELLRSLGADHLRPDSALDRLGGADYQLVEICKALVAEPSVLILDEPTAALTSAETRQLMQQVRRLKDKRLPIIYVTHRLAEVFEIADRVTVMRGGEVVLSETVSDVTRSQLVDAVAGRKIDASIRPTVGESTYGAPVLELRGMVADGIGPLDLTLRAGEVLGIYGLLGSGRTELVEALFGVRPVAHGEVRLDGRRIRPRRPREGIRRGLALVPSDRLRQGIFLTLPGRDNLLLTSLSKLATAGVLRRPRNERRVFAHIAERVNLQPRRDDIPGRGYSGGNQQKLVIGRWLTSDSRVLLLDEPTQGVDVGARSDLYRALDEVAAGGRAVMVTSSEPEELVQVAHRVVVLAHGRVAAEVRGREIDEHHLLTLAHAGENDRSAHVR
jgi:ribose transport system ATP-binding protein